MQSTRSKIITIFLFLSLVIPIGSALAEDAMLVVATQKTYEASEAWVDFLKDQDVPIKHVTPKVFEADKKAPFVVIMGSLDEADGVQSLVKECLTKTEYQLVSQVNTGEVLFKSKIWDPDQSLIVITGSNWPSTEAARKDYREEWLEVIGEWFDLELSGPTMQAY